MLKNYGKLDNRYFQNKLKKIASYCKGSVLDVGGYTGELSRYIKGTYVLVDGDKDAINYFNDRTMRESYLIDLNKESLPKGRLFNSVVLSDLIDIVFDADKLLTESVAIAKDKVIISVTNDNTIYHRLRVLFGKGINKTPFCIHYHLRHPTFKQWEEFIDKYLVRKEVSYWICFRKEKPLWLDWILLKLADSMPNLFARVAIYECRLRSK